MRSRYDLAQVSTTKSSSGTYYKDIFTIPTQNIVLNESAQEYELTESDIKRSDIMMHDIYNFAELDDILFWINNIGFIYEQEIGKTILIPTLRDLEKFYYQYRE